ncbi:hypothetical protein AQF52_2228 [Streptomyces venezuelae]|nr:hypothetical protein AQF52_2228 [Streptomyces venezuelae]CUM41842.1 hypothetical protein BN2537_12649 [Streptomyces venezuelae]
MPGTGDRGSSRAGSAHASFAPMPLYGDTTHTCTGVPGAAARAVPGTSLRAVRGCRLRQLDRGDYVSGAVNPHTIG